jgi:hypothetical protein
MESKAPSRKSVSISRSGEESGDGGGGEFRVMAVICVFFCGSAPFFEREGAKKKEESKKMIVT